MPKVKGELVHTAEGYENEITTYWQYKLKIMLILET
jgi:hypothetical protein